MSLAILKSIIIVDSEQYNKWNFFTIRSKEIYNSNSYDAKKKNYKKKESMYEV